MIYQLPKDFSWIDYNIDGSVFLGSHRRVAIRLHHAVNVTTDSQVPTYYKR